MQLMFSALCSALATGVAAGLFGTAAVAQDLKETELLRADLAGMPGKEVVVSLIEVGPDQTLAKHRHVGEEFVYVVDGFHTFHGEGVPDVELTPGDALHVPFQIVHSATTKTAVRVVVFRIHDKGQPSRINVE